MTEENLSVWQRAKQEHDIQSQKEIFNFLEGDNEIEIDLTRPPSTFKNKYGNEQHIINLVDGKICFVNPVLFKMIMERLERDDKLKEQSVILKINRVGLEHTNTRYTLL